MFYWLEQTIAVLPYVLWIYLGLGLPYALLALPRRHWRDYPMPIALSFAFGSGLLTAWMFILGTIGGQLNAAWLRLDTILIGTIVLAIIGCVLLWLKIRRIKLTTHETTTTWSSTEIILIALIILAIAIRWLVTSFWTFTAYDALWVYGYQSRVWLLQGYISPDVGYYPQFMQLQYTFLQLAAGSIDDYAARAIVPFLHVGSILATYTLGKLLFNRRVGIIAAAIWTLYPHVAQWAYVGDLEIPLTFTFTLTVAFFLKAWLTDDDATLRRQYALIAGLCFGIAMWTKPTAGAFIWGVIVLVIADFVRVRANITAWYPRFEVAAITGLACIPLGASWYLRNIALGHPPLVFPHESWLAQATRSGDLLSWVVLALLAASFYIVWKTRQGAWWLMIGTLLIALGAMPTSPLMLRTVADLFSLNMETLRINPPESYLRWYEWLLVASGAGLMLWHLRQFINDKNRPQVITVGWLYLLALPYFMTWFYSYSYHARLVFAITPILLLPTTAILAHILPALPRRGVLNIGIIVLGVPLALASYGSATPYLDWLWNPERLPNDFAKYRAHNPGVTLSAEYLLGWRDENGTEPIVIAPGEQRLPFFLPQATIITDTVPTRLDDLENATHYQYGSQARWRYENDEGIPPDENQLVSALGRSDVLPQLLKFEDGRFRYELYEVQLDKRYVTPEASIIDVPLDADNEVLFGDLARYWGDNVGNTQLAGNTIFLAFLWEVLAETENDYQLRIDLRYEATGDLYEKWTLDIRPHIHGDYEGDYSTSLWQAGEMVLDEHAIQLQQYREDLPFGGGYRMYLNLVDRQTGQALPVTINGDDAPLGYPMRAPFQIGVAQ